MTTADPSPPEIPPPYFGSTFSHWVTIVLGVLLALLFTLVSVPRSAEQRVKDLEHPIESTVRLFERALELEDALDAAPAWMRRVGEIALDTSSETLSESVRAYRDVLAALPLQPDEGRSEAAHGSEPNEPSRTLHHETASRTSNDADPSKIDAEPSDATRDRREELVELRARLAILLAESGRWDDAREELARLDEAGEKSLADAVRRAYGEIGFATPRTLDKTRGADASHTLDTSRAADASDLDRFQPGWAKDRLSARLAQRTGDTVLATRLRAEAVQRGDRWRKHTLFLTLMFLTPCLLGLVLLLAWLWKDRPPVLVASAHIPSAWSWSDGCAALVRSAFAGLVFSSLIALVSQAFHVTIFSLWVTLIASLPMLWLIRRALLAPYALGFRPAFGLWPVTRSTNTPSSFGSVEAASPRAELASEPALARRVFSWVAFTLGLITLHQLGAAVLSVVCLKLGIEPHWSEGVQESLIWAPKPQALLGAVDGVFWAPIFEEIGCRGLLYLTLRTRAGPHTAAFFSASLFAMVHLYSLPGFLSVMWSGYIWAVAFERCRSLVPGMICHAFWNGFLITGNYLFYR